MYLYLVVAVNGAHYRRIRCVIDTGVCDWARVGCGIPVDCDEGVTEICPRSRVHF